MSSLLESRILNKQGSSINSVSGQPLSLLSRLVHPTRSGAAPAVSASLAAYDIHDASVSAAVEVTVGAREAQGKLPIQLSIEP